MTMAILQECAGRSTGRSDSRLVVSSDAEKFAREDRSVLIFRIFIGAFAPHAMRGKGIEPLNVYTSGS